MGVFFAYYLTSYTRLCNALYCILWVRHGLVFKNFFKRFCESQHLFKINFKNFIIGRDHAGYKNFYPKYSSQNIFKIKDNLKIKILKTREPLMCSKCGKISSESKFFCKCNNVKNRLLTIDGTKVRKLIKSKNFKKLSKFINQDLLKYLSKKA